MGAQSASWRSHISAPCLHSQPSRCLPRDPGGRGGLRGSGVAMESREGLLQGLGWGKVQTEGSGEEEGS